MGMTITEKILCRHTDLKEIHPGMLINARVDIALGNDITAPIAIAEFRKAGGIKVFDRDKVVLIPDHFTPNKDIDSAQQCKFIREFAREQGLTHYYDVGEVGIEHALLPEQGIVLPGDLVIGADSHTCTYGALGAFATGVGSTDLAAVMMTGEVWFRVPETMKIVFSGKMKKWVSGKDLILYIIGSIGVDGALYKAMEFTGETIGQLSMADRLTIANMVIEAGAKNGIFIPDDITKAYVAERAKRPYSFYNSDPDARYVGCHQYRCRRNRAPGGIPPYTFKRQGDQPGGQYQNRSGCYRVLHQRQDRRPQGCSGHSQKEEGRARCPFDHRSRHAGNIQTGPSGRPHRDIYRCTCSGQHADLRRLSGRSYGRISRRREGRFHNEQEFHRAHGSYRQ